MESLSNIYIPFRKRIRPDGNRFTIALPRKKIEEGYQFYFGNLSLTPDLFSKRSQAMGYDPELEQEFEYYYPFQLEFNYGAEYYKSDKNANKYIQDPRTETDINTTLIAINKFFEGTKVVGQKWPPVIFDWGLLTGIQSGMDLNEFNKMPLKFLYNKTEDDPSFHDWLPAGSRMPGINNWAYPTEPKDPMTLKTTYIRMHLAPNVEIGFSNDGLLNAFGFTTNQYVPKTAANAQIKFYNPDPCNYLTIVGEAPVGTMKATVNNKITLYIHSKKVRSPEGVLVTKRKNLIDPAKLAEDYNKGFSEMAEICQHSLTLNYKPSTKTFSFTYPTTPNLTTDIYLDPEVAEQIGYPKGTNKITQGTEPKPLANEQDISDFIKIAQTIVYDVGQATVYLEGETNFQTIQFNNKVMATLVPQTDGTMRLQCNSGPDVPTAFVSYFGMPQLEFYITRFSEASEPVPLSLPIGSYIEGQLVGRKV